jgi:hypothetical protein
VKPGALPEGAGSAGDESPHHCTPVVRKPDNCSGWRAAFTCLRYTWAASVNDESKAFTIARVRVKARGVPSWEDEDGTTSYRENEVVNLEFHAGVQASRFCVVHVW